MKIQLQNSKKQVGVTANANAKMVVMKNNAMMIQTEHYTDIKKQCLKLEDMVKKLIGEEGVLVHEKSLKTIEAEIEHVRKNLLLIARLDRAVNNYRDNLNSLYRHPDMTLTADRALGNLILSASHYMGYYRAVLMQKEKILTQLWYDLFLQDICLAVAAKLQFSGN